MQTGLEPVVIQTLVKSSSQSYFGHIDEGPEPKNAAHPSSTADNPVDATQTSALEVPFSPQQSNSPATKKPKVVRKRTAGISLNPKRYNADG